MHASLSSVYRSPARSNDTTVPQFHGLYGRVLWLVAREDVDMVVVQSSSGNHESVRVESRCGDWSRSIAQEARVGLEVRHELSVVDVEDLYTMLLSSTAIWLVDVFSSLCTTYVAKTGACS